MPKSYSQVTERYTQEQIEDFPAVPGAHNQGVWLSNSSLIENAPNILASMAGYNTTLGGVHSGDGVGLTVDGDDKPKDMPLVKQTMVMIVLLSVAYTLVFLLAIVNNSLVVAVIYRVPQMRNVTNYFLANLAIADITVSIINLPITLLNNIYTGKSIFCSAYICICCIYLPAKANLLTLGPWRIQHRHHGCRTSTLLPSCLLSFRGKT